MIELQVKGRRFDNCFCNPVLKNPLISFDSVTGYVLEDDATIVVMLKNNNNMRLNFEFAAPAKCLMALLFDEDLRTYSTVDGKKTDDFTRFLTRRKPTEGI